MTCCSQCEMIHTYRCTRCNEIFHTGCFDSVKRYEYKVEKDPVTVGERMLELMKTEVNLLCNSCIAEERWEDEGGK